MERAKEMPVALSNQIKNRIFLFLTALQNCLIENVFWE